MFANFIYLFAPCAFSCSVGFSCSVVCLSHAFFSCFPQAFSLSSRVTMILPSLNLVFCFVENFLIQIRFYRFTFCYAMGGTVSLTGLSRSSHHFREIFY